MSEKNSITVKTHMKLDDVISYLNDLTSSLKAGKVFVQNGEEFIELNPKKSFFVEVKASVKKEKEKFNLELTWKNEDIEATVTELKITSKKPEIEVVRQKTEEKATATSESEQKEVISSQADAKKKTAVSQK